MTVRPARYINSRHPLLEDHLDFISRPHHLSLSTALPFLVSLFIARLYRITRLRDILGSCSVPARTLDQCWSALSSRCPSTFFLNANLVTLILGYLDYNPSHFIVTLELHA